MSESFIDSSTSRIDKRFTPSLTTSNSTTSTTTNNNTSDIANSASNVIVLVTCAYA